MVTSILNTSSEYRISFKVKFKEESASLSRLYVASINKKRDIDLDDIPTSTDTKILADYYVQTHILTHISILHVVTMKNKSIEYCDRIGSYFDIDMYEVGLSTGQYAEEPLYYHSTITM